MFRLGAHRVRKMWLGMSRLVILVVLAMALAITLPDTTEATTFNEVKKLTASDPQDTGRFGGGMAVSGDTAVVGAYQEEAGGFRAGAAYVFDILLPKPTATPGPVGGIGVFPDSGDSSGSSVAVFTGFAAIVTAIALSGAAWFARRRRA